MKRGATVVSWAICIGGFLVLCAGGTLFAQQAPPAALKHVQEGLKQFDIGEIDKAVAELEAALQATPGSAEALALLVQVGEHKLYKLLENEKTRAKAMALFKLAEKEEARKATDPAEIKQIITNLSGEFDTRWRATLKLVQIGDYAVPYLLDLLHTNQPTATTAAAQIALDKIGWRGVLPLIEALNCDSAFVKQGVCAVLANIGDVRAVPPLKAVVENPKEQQQVRLAAARALETLTGQSVGRLESAADLYYGLAEKYYYEDPTVMRHVGPITPVWAWKRCDAPSFAQKIVFFPEPDYAYNDIVAEHFCLAGLKCDPRHYKLRGLLTATYCSLIGETEAILAGHARPGLLKREPSEEEMKELQARNTKLNLWRNNAAANGSEFLNAALKRAVADKDPAVALAAIKGLRRLKDDRPEGQAGALREALGCREKRVRYAAAEALIHISPGGRMGATDLTMRVVASALGETSKRTILICEPDLQNRNRLKGILKGQGYNVIDTDSMNKARSRILLGIPPVDLLLMAPKVGGAQTDTFARALKGSAAAVNMAIFILSNPKEVSAVQDVYGKAADAVLPANITEKDVVAKVQETFKRPAAQTDEAAAMTAVIKKTCRVLTETDPPTTKYPLSMAAPALLNLIRDKDNAIRKVALDAMGHAGRPEDRKAIAMILADTSAAKEVRIAAAQAIEKIMKRASKFCPCCAGPLLAAVGDADPDVAAAAAKAIGNSPATVDYVVKVLQTYQMIPVTPAAAPAAKKAGAKFADVKALMMCMKKNRDEAMAAMKAKDMKAVQAKLEALAKLAECGKANFSMTEMLGKGYDMMKMACDDAAKAAGGGDAAALMAAVKTCQESCMTCHQKCRQKKEE
ncbi:MAG: hypothetical protein GXP25_05905 [Planctomycetes bacterium]|nr:hypothetical protein [Planctomycetota bacterium]